MRALINGVEGGTNIVFKGADDSLKGMVIQDDGSPIDITANTMSLEIHSSKVRATPVATFSGVIATATAGYFTIALAAGSMTFGPGIYYGYVKRVAGGSTSYGDTPSTITVQ